MKDLAFIIFTIVLSVSVFIICQMVFMFVVNYFINKMVASPPMGPDESYHADNDPCKHGFRTDVGECCYCKLEAQGEK